MSSASGVRGVYGFRSIAAHAYLDIDLERVWVIVTDHLPGSRNALEAERRSARS